MVLQPTPPHRFYFLNIAWKTTIAAYVEHLSVHVLMCCGDAAAISHDASSSDAVAEQRHGHPAWFRSCQHQIL